MSPGLPTSAEVWWERVKRALATAPHVPWAERETVWEPGPDGTTRLRPETYRLLLEQFEQALRGDDEAAQLSAADRLGEHLGVGPHPDQGQGPRAT